jgi:hypothetical protein
MLKFQIRVEKGVFRTHRPTTRGRKQMFLLGIIVFGGDNPRNAEIVSSSG